MAFPFVIISIHEIDNAVKSFGKLLVWDRVKSTKACLVVKIRVEEMKDIPTNIVIGEGDDFQTNSKTVPIVIIQQSMLGGGECLMEVPLMKMKCLWMEITPIPLQAHYHPNQSNHFFGPIQQHELQDFRNQPVGHHNQLML